jgi:hypothetical protein
MKIDDFVQDVVDDVTKDDKVKFSPILLWVIKEVVMMAITWFINNYKDDPSKAVEDFLNFFKNLNFWNKLRWVMKVQQVTKKYKNLDSKAEISGAVAGKFAKLDEAAVRAMFEQAISARTH